MNTVPAYWEPFTKMMYEMVGDPKADSLMMRAASPVSMWTISSAALHCPRPQDPRVNKDESDQVVAALKARGIEVQYLVRKHEGHGFHNEETGWSSIRHGKILDEHMVAGTKPLPQSCGRCGNALIRQIERSNKSRPSQTFLRRAALFVPWPY